jgi:hypothetical protein
MALTMHAVMLYFTMSATLCALRIVTTVIFGAGDAIAGAIAAPTVRFVLMEVTSESPSCKSSICAAGTNYLGDGLMAAKPLSIPLRQLHVTCPIHMDMGTL